MNQTKPSEIFDTADKFAEIENNYIDMQNQRIKYELQFLYNNYNNIDVLRTHFLQLYNVGNVIANASYAQHLNSLPANAVQHLADYRANYLHYLLFASENSKINNKPLKSIAEILKLFNK